MHSDPETTTLKETRMLLEKQFPTRPELAHPQMRMLVIEEIRTALQTQTNNLPDTQEQRDHQLALQLAQEEQQAARRRPSRRAKSGKNGSSAGENISSRRKKGSTERKSTNVSHFPTFQTSPKLCAFLGGRTEITTAEAIKLIWAHIKEANLQDPTDRRYILVDEKLRAIFGNCRRVHMFHLGRLVQQHLFRA